MLTTSPGYTKNFKLLSRRINKQYRHLRHNVSERNQTDDGNATFEDFVNYLLSVDIMTTDVHFRSYLGSCKPCDADYDYVIKLETLKNDMEYLKQKLNISDYHRQAVFPNRNFKTIPSLVQSTFRQIPSNLALQLYEKYKIDFDIFGYERPEWIC